jgi:hypothetical protein
MSEENNIIEEAPQKEVKPTVEQNSFESDKKTNAGQGLGIAGFVLGLVALIISFIPCLGMYALVPGIIAIILTAIAFSQASKKNGAKGLIIAALVVSILGTAIATWQYYVLSTAANAFVEGIENYDEAFKDAINDVEKDGVLDDSALNNINEEVDKYIADEDYDKLIDVYEQTIDKYVSKMQNLEEGDLASLGAGVAYVTQITAMSVKIATVVPKFNEAQMERFNNIDEKYKDIENK